MLDGNPYICFCIRMELRNRNTGMKDGEDLQDESSYSHRGAREIAFVLWTPFEGCAIPVIHLHLFGTFYYTLRVPHCDGNKGCEPEN